MRTSLYVRLPVETHQRFFAYARWAGVSANMAAEMLIDQLLAQVDPEFRWPDWLREAVAAGELPFQMPEQGDHEPLDEEEPQEPGQGRALRAV